MIIHYLLLKSSYPLFIRSISRLQAMKSSQQRKCTKKYQCYYFQRVWFLEVFFYKPYPFQNICNIVYPPLLDLSKPILCQESSINSKDIHATHRITITCAFHIITSCDKLKGDATAPGEKNPPYVNPPA